MGKLEIIDVVGALKFSVSWLTNGKVWLIALILFILNCIHSVVGAFVTSAIYNVSLMSIFIGAAGRSAETRAILYASSNPQAMFVNLGASLAVYIPYMIIASYLSAFIYRISLEKRGFTIAQFDPSRFINYVLLRIAFYVSVLFPFFDKRLLAASFVCAILVALGAAIAAFHMVVGPIAVLLMLLAMAAGLVWFFIMAYSLTRLLSANAIFLNQGKGVVDSLKGAVSLTDGRVQSTFISCLCVFIPIVAVFVCVSIPLTFLSAAFAQRVIVGSIAIQLVLLAIAAFILQPVEIFSVTAIYDWLMNPAAASKPSIATVSSQAVSSDASAVSLPLSKPKAKPAAKKSVAKKR